MTSRITLVTVVGNSFEYTMITPMASWAAFDGEAPLAKALGAAGAAALNDKLRKCIMTQNSYLINREDDLTIAAPGAEVWRTTVRRALPGKMQEYLAFYKAEVLPAMQKAKAEGKIAGSGVATRGVGALSREFTVSTVYNKFADLDGPNPVAAAVGAEAARAMAAKGETLATTGQTYIRRRVADLSF